MPEVAFPLLTLQNTARSRPEGYLEEILSVSRIDEKTNTVYIPALHFIALKQKYNPEHNVESTQTFGEALTEFINYGFTIAPNTVYNERLKICEKCPLWDSTAYNNTGKCKVCNCRTEVTLRLATSKCPVGYW